MNLENLTTLTINNCLSINGECFLTLKNLQDLDICYCHNIKFKYLSNLKKLINLNVRESGIKDKDLTELNNMKYLNVKYCSELVSGKFLLDMNKLTQLECFEEPLNKIEIDKLKNEIKKGNTFKCSIAKVINKRDRNI